jgi:hypothetical protein
MVHKTFNFTRRYVLHCRRMWLPRMTEKKQIVLAKLFLVLVISVAVIPLDFILLLTHYPAFAYYGQDVLLSLDSAEYMPLKKVEGNQVEVFVKYMVNNSSIINNQINCVMKVYYPNGTLIKTSSPPDEVIITNSSGILRHATTPSPDSKIENLTAVVQLTDITKSLPISNSVTVPLVLGESTKNIARFQY